MKATERAKRIYSLKIAHGKQVERRERERKRGWWRFWPWPRKKKIQGARESLSFSGIKYQWFRPDLKKERVGYRLCIRLRDEWRDKCLFPASFFFSSLPFASFLFFFSPSAHWRSSSLADEQHINHEERPTDLLGPFLSRVAGITNSRLRRRKVECEGLT